MSLTVLEFSKQNESIQISSERNLNQFSLSSETSVLQCVSNEGIFSAEEVQIEKKFCSSDDLNPDQNDDHNEDDCTGDEEEIDDPKNQLLERGDTSSCGNHSEGNSTAPTSQEELDNQSSFPLDQILPCKVGNLSIKKLGWEDFTGTPNYDLKWSAHAFWGINYTYTVHQKTAKNKKVSYTMKPEVNVWLKKKSWAKKHNPHLLNHEQGHYIIGCFCGLEFKKQMIQYEFTDNYRFEIPRLFEKILKEHISMEKRYDKETSHRMNREKQTEWDNYMLSKMQEYQRYFQMLEVTAKNKSKPKKKSS